MDGKVSVKEGGPSRTALIAALMRAVHTRLDRPQLIDDRWGDRLGAEPAARKRLETLRAQQAIIDAVLRSQGTYGGVILRSRYAEDALESAVARGARQYFLIGAGFDSLLVRQPPFAGDIDIFEIDHPASQAMKRQRLEECGAKIPPNVQFVPADLTQEPLESVLARCSFCRALPAFFSWLGVAIYLSRDANLATLRGMATSSAPGSEVVFTYIDQRDLDERQSARLEKMRATRAALGEAWLSGFDPATLENELTALGLHLVEDLGSSELRSRYCAGRMDGLSPGTSGHVARARVTGG